MTQFIRGKWALVTGASSGLGADFARILANRGCNLILVARRESRLQELAREITQRYSVAVEVMPADLSRRAEVEGLYARTKALGRKVEILINNAGFGVHGSFLSNPWEREHEALELDVVSLAHLTRLYTPGMVASGAGWILQVSSIGAFQPTPTYASYAAAKAYVLHFGEALNHELSGTGVSCTVLCPGVTRTEFLQVSGQAPTFYQRMVMMDSETVVRKALDGMLARKRVIVPGWINWLGALSVRFLPRSWQTSLAHKLMV